MAATAGGTYLVADAHDGTVGRVHEPLPGHRPLRPARPVRVGEQARHPAVLHAGEQVEQTHTSWPWLGPRLPLGRDGGGVTAARRVLPGVEEVQRSVGGEDRFDQQPGDRHRVEEFLRLAGRHPGRVLFRYLSCARPARLLFP